MAYILDTKWARSHFKEGDKIIKFSGGIRSGVVVKESDLPEEVTLKKGVTQGGLPVPIQWDGGEFDLVNRQSVSKVCFAVGVRVYRHAGGPVKYGVIPARDGAAKAWRVARSHRDECLPVRWDDGSLEVCLQENLTPIIMS